MNVFNTVVESFNVTLSKVISYIPNVLAALVLLFAGVIIGRAVGKIAAKVVDKSGIDKAVEKTPISSIVESSGFSIIGFVDAISRWFIYLIFLIATINVLNISVLSIFLNEVVGYLPHLFAGVAVLVVGVVAIDFIANWIESLTKEAKIEEGNMVVRIFRAFLFLVVIIFALDQMRVDTTIIYMFLKPLAWGVAAAVAIRWGFAELVKEYKKKK
ncbi:MAG: hypothetical protein ACE5NL_01955 [Candidatus Hydrothermarchaeaceae archaeon]